MIQIVPEIYITDCRKALHFYQQLFGGEIRNLRMSEDMELFRDIKGKVVHSELHVNNRCVFYFVDILRNEEKKAGNITLVLHFKSEEKLEAVYTGLSHRGKVEMKLQKTWKNEYHAILTDRFGAPWALNYAPSGK